MAMTKSRKASGSTSRRATSRPKSAVDPLTILDDDDEYAKHIVEMRKLTGDEFSFLTRLHAGEKGDRRVAYTQKLHWAFLDMAAAEKVAFRILIRGLKHTNERVAQLEAELRKAKSLTRKSADPAFAIEQGDDLRTFTIKSASGEQSFTVPVPIHRGPWKEDRAYAHGDEVVWGGSTWIAMRDTDAKPDADDSGWVIAARRGRDGKSVRTEK